MEMLESHWRSLAKAVSWRVTGTMDTIVVAYLITGQTKTAVSIGLVEVVTKTIIYYFHERIWMKIKFGRRDTQDFSI